jgi:hypothetical protein
MHRGRVAKIGSNNVGIRPQRLVCVHNSFWVAAATGGGEDNRIVVRNVVVKTPHFFATIGCDDFISSEVFHQICLLCVR